jgi:hypothetical protein
MLPAELAVETQGAGQQPMERVHILLFPSIEQAGTAGMWLRPETQYMIIYKNRSHLGYGEGETGASTKSPTTKRPPLQNVQNPQNVLPENVPPETFPLQNVPGYKMPSPSYTTVFSLRVILDLIFGNYNFEMYIMVALI